MEQAGQCHQSPRHPGTEPLPPTEPRSSRFRGRPGRPRGPMTGEIASTRGSSWVASWALADERRTASGMPFRSTTRWYLEPALPRSVGWDRWRRPPFLPGRSGCRRSPATSRRRPHRRANRAPERAASPRPQLPANHEAAASRWCRYRSRVRSAASVRDSRFVARRRCPARVARTGTRGRPPFGFRGSSGNSGSMAFQRSSGPSGVFMTRKRQATSQGFATRSKSAGRRAG
jgi:hypothetical protein